MVGVSARKSNSFVLARQLRVGELEEKEALRI